MFSDDFDKLKSDKTKAERGIDFVEARAIWMDPDCIEVPARNVDGEVRAATIGLIDGQIWVALWTLRAGLIRIFSVHRADGTAFERKYYEAK